MDCIYSVLSLIRCDCCFRCCFRGLAIRLDNNRGVRSLICQPYHPCVYITLITCGYWAKKRCDWRPFFSFLQKKKFFPKMDNIFLEKRKKLGKKIAAARLASILATRGGHMELWGMGWGMCIISAVYNSRQTLCWW